VVAVTARTARFRARRRPHSRANILLSTSGHVTDQIAGDLGRLDHHDPTTGRERTRTVCHPTGIALSRSDHRRLATVVASFGVLTVEDSCFARPRPADPTPDTTSPTRTPCPTHHALLATWIATMLG
jgi:hypothetical protein